MICSNIKISSEIADSPKERELNYRPPDNKHADYGFKKMCSTKRLASTTISYFYTLLQSFTSIAAFLTFKRPYRIQYMS